MKYIVDISSVKLETERLILRPFEVKDLEDFFEYASVEGVGECAGWNHHENIEVSKDILTDFIKEQVAQFVCDDLDPLGKEIIDCCLHDGTLDDYLALTPMKLK